MLSASEAQKPPRRFFSPWLSVPDGRFPRARLQSPRRCAPAGLSAGGALRDFKPRNYK